MGRNDSRRAALIDGAIEVLAREGARKLTFRAVDVESDVPVGTSSNYFASRDDLLMQAGARVYERFKPDPDLIARQRRLPAGQDAYVTIMRDRVSGARGHRIQRREAPSVRPARGHRRREADLPRSAG